MSIFKNMTKDEAIKYCYKHRERYIREAQALAVEGGLVELNSRIPHGIRDFECLISLLDNETIFPSQLPGYGMDYESSCDDTKNDVENIGEEISEVISKAIDKIREDMTPSVKTAETFLALLRAKEIIDNVGKLSINHEYN